MVSPVSPASDFDRIARHLSVWHAYDTRAKAELYSTFLLTSGGAYLVDPVPLQSEALDELLGPARVTGIIVTNGNHLRATTDYSARFSVPIFVTSAAFAETSHGFLHVADRDKIGNEFGVIEIAGAGPGEIALHHSADKGTLVMGDALINFKPYGFTFLPGKYCSNEKEMRRSLRKLLDYKAERILFAHGTPILSGASDRLRDLLDSNL
jgi:hypothetical protein